MKKEKIELQLILDENKSIIIYYDKDGNKKEYGWCNYELQQTGKTLDYCINQVCNEIINLKK